MFDFLLGMFFVYLILKVLLEILSIKLVNDLRKEKGALEGLLEKEETEKTQVDVEIEVVGEMVYMFDKENGNFLAQGKSFDEIKEHLISRKFTNMVFNIDKETLKILPFKFDTIDSSTLKKV